MEKDNFDPQPGKAAGADDSGNTSPGDRQNDDRSGRPLISKWVAIVCAAAIVSGVAGAGIMANIKLENENAPAVYKKAETSGTAETSIRAAAADASAVSAITTTALTAVSRTERAVQTKAVTTRKSTSAATSVTAETTHFDYPQDINLASPEALLNVNGINKTAAEGIIEYRERNGAIHSFNELLEIYGIGERTLSVIQGHFFISETDLPEQTVITTASSREQVTEETLPETETKAVTQITSAETSAQTARVTEAAGFRPVNINSATTEELEECLLIKRETAERIVELRRNIGRFSNSLELLYTEGFSNEMYTERKEYLLLEDTDS